MDCLMPQETYKPLPPDTQSGGLGSVIRIKKLGHSKVCDFGPVSCTNQENIVAREVSV